MSNPDFSVDIDVMEQLKEPSLYKVIFLNDDLTPFEFVIAVLMGFFQMEEGEAVEFANTVHTEGKGVAGTYTLEIASQKQSETVTAARDQGYPLRVLLEEVA